jgi:hypothetical protein
MTDVAAIIARAELKAGTSRRRHASPARRWAT